jgi:hypothetical protein
MSEKEKEREKRMDREVDDGLLPRVWIANEIEITLAISSLLIAESVGSGEHV